MEKDAISVPSIGATTPRSNATTERRASAQTTSLDLSSDSPKQSTEYGLFRNPPSLSDCQASIVQLYGSPPTRLATCCTEKTNFIVPVFGRDLLINPRTCDSEASQINHQEVFSVCTNHHVQYVAHVNQNKCLVIGRNAPGDEYQSKNNVTVRECAAHAKLRILHENLDSEKIQLSCSPKTPTPSTPSAQVTPDSPPMPPLEPCTSFSNTSELSLASSTGLLDARVKDIGGKNSFTDAPDFIGEGEEEPSGHQPVQDGQKEAKSKGTSLSTGKKRKNSPHVLEYSGEPGVVPIEHVVAPQSIDKSLRRKSEPTRRGHFCADMPSSGSDSHSDTGSSSRSSSNSSRQSSSSSFRKHKRHKKSKRGSKDIADLLPKGLCFPKIKSARPAVRYSIVGEDRIQPTGEYGALMNRIGAMSEREHKTVNGFNKIDEFTVCALRGFGLRKTVLGTGTYGTELEQCLRRQARSEKDRLWQEKSVSKSPIALQRGVRPADLACLTEKVPKMCVSPWRTVSV